MTRTKQLFLFTFFITVLARAMTWHEINWIPYTFIYIVFIGFWFFLMLVDNASNPTISLSKANLIIFLLILYNLIWGFSNIQNLDYQDTLQVVLRSLLMIAFFIVSKYWINRLNCLKDVINTTFYALATLMLLLFIFHINEINIISTLKTFWVNSESIRTRALFGFRVNNIAAEYAMSVILLSLIEWKYNTSIDKYVVLRKAFLILIDIIMLLIIIANNSRGTLLALIFISLILIVLEIRKRMPIKRKLRLLITLIIILVLSISIYLSLNNISIEQLLSVMNRTHFLDNIEVLKNSGRWFMGLGIISGDYFHAGHILYGAKLNYMEMYYVGVFVMSGIIGCIWMLSIILLIFNAILKNAKNNDFLTKWIILVFIYMLFISLFEGYIFSSSYITSTLFLLFILSFISGKFKSIKTIVGKPNG